MRPCLSKKILNAKWKYIFTTGKRDLGIGYATGHGPSGVYHWLYNLESDPNETTNLAYDTEFQEMVHQFQEEILDRFMNTHPMAHNVPSGLNTTGKIIWFCDPTDMGSEPGDELQRIFENKANY